MIVKSAVRTLRQPETGPEARLEALQDIDAEVVRLNRIVTEVLDYAKPLSFTWQVTDPNAVCREAVQAVQIAEPEVVIELVLAPGIRPIHTDAERLRTVLVNVLTNASQAVRAARDKAPERPSAPGPGVELRTAPMEDGGAIIVVHDQGGGIAPALLPRVFEPYFTTRRAGTGLGLAIARNIIEGLGGTITIRSEPSAGTELRIELPRQAPTAPGHPGTARA